jgi:RNA polymerase sigma factor (sigma-70 family)
MNDGHDAKDARLVDSGEHARRLATYEPVIIGRCVAALRGSLDAEDVAQDVKLRLWRELSRGKRYPVPFRVVVHKVIGWTLQDYFGGRDTTLALPEDWLADAADPIGELDAQASVAGLLAGLPERQRQCWTLRLAGLEPEQIAAELGMKRNAVDQALHTGGTTLREALTGG